MKMLDVNVVLYAYHDAMPDHERARTWFEELLSTSEVVLFPLVTILGFIRISTDSRVLREPFSLDEAFEIVESWLERKNSRIADPMPTHFAHFRKLAMDGQSRADASTDAHIAALARDYGAELCTADRGFSRFTGVKIFNPLLSHE